MSNLCPRCSLETRSTWTRWRELMCFSLIFPGELLQYLPELRGRTLDDDDSGEEEGHRVSSAIRPVTSGVTENKH